MGLGSVTFKDGVRREIKSIFTKGDILSNSDGSYKRLYPNTCNRHIIIDDYELGAGTGYNTDDVAALSDAFEKSTQLSDMIMRHLIYSTLPDLLVNRVNGLKSNVIARYNTVTAKYDDMLKQSKDFYVNECGEDGIKSTKGNPKKIELLGDKMLNKRRRMLLDIIDMYRTEIPSIKSIGDWNYKDCAMLAYDTSDDMKSNKISSAQYNNYYMNLLSHVDEEGSEWERRYHGILQDIIDERLTKESYGLYELMMQFN